MREKWKPLLALIYLTWFIFGIFTFSKIGYQYVGKSYFQSTNFQNELEAFQAELGPLVLNVPTAEELKSKITVTDSEIEEHRNYYGSLGTQIDNIKSQYEEKIQEAADNNAVELKTKLENERDAKIKDITKNFEDDEYVRKKIVAQKGALVDKYIKAIKDESKEFGKRYKYWSYELTNTETEETYRSGDISESSVYKKSFINHPLRTGVISNNSSHLLYGSEVYLESELLNETTEYTGTISISKNAAQSAEVMAGYDQFKRNQYLFSVIWLTCLIAAVFVWKWRKELLPTIGSLKEKETLAKLRIDVQIALLFITGCLYWMSSSIAFETIEYTYQSNYVRFLTDFVFILLVLIIISVVFFVQAIWLYERVNTVEKLSENVKDSYLWGIGESMTDLFLNRSIALHSIVLVAAAFFGGGSFVASVVTGGGFPIMVFGICTIVGIPALVVFLSKMGYLNRIMKDTKDMAEGRLNRDVKVKGKSPLAAHAENLNHLREGVRTSMHEQAKSERLKTELITNVSHDLRTPLTSIITYTDLLKNPDITEEERKQYIHILDKKSDRLKVLIEDLFEVSKMASGNIELHRSRVDVTQLVQQAVGEHEEDLCKARLDLRMSMPQDAIYAYVDGQKWWRLIDNLIVNVLKYALEGTRVYVTLKRTTNGDAEFTVKNVAKYEISENADELFERFKRADASRHTEGSGLGLAIAQSIVDLHGARMSIEVDGDLFKVIVRIPAV
ncbi:histidine kinase dimerization/phospho-acceptor domain-containing protein [Lysinibacillus sp. NPDC097195]|uniref:histidine kinase dimerization/phospho-acceptor domain-containing protein n=1 Tax=Lysinibacillus sp. NPDC097195 TaxID=3364141 RepID=UPI0037F92AA0